MGGHVYLIATLAGSFAVVAPGGAHFAGDLSGAFTGIVGRMFLIAFNIAAPAAAVLLVVDIAFGIVARTIPQMHIFIVGMPAKIIIGLSRSEEHTSELQSRLHLVCRLLLEKKK